MAKNANETVQKYRILDGNLAESIKIFHRPYQP